MNDPDEKRTAQLPEVLPAHDSDLLGNGEPSDLEVKEAKQLASGKESRDLKREATEKDHDRQQKFLDVFENVLISGLIMGAALIALMAIVLVYHLSAPLNWRFLDPEDVNRIKDILSGGLFVTLISDQAKKRLKRSEND